MVWNVRNRRKEEKDVCAYTERQYDALMYRCQARIVIVVIHS